MLLKLTIHNKGEKKFDPTTMTSCNEYCQTSHFVEKNEANWEVWHSPSMCVKFKGTSVRLHLPNISSFI